VIEQERSPARLADDDDGTIAKNVIRHVTDVLQGEFRHSTSIGPDLSKSNKPTAYAA
jgi:hypothetical protein